ncbi:hypothetical protein N7474_006035 [Penicillium riverlandense]|uniref:uncharacterized protein n=1 Tax=Penicillium riverlandense TaxID=1903569 RepID=UPI0025492CAB|nr:uncharacterized protein N7474_006035 [Penicillium riverlandense]KAJ5820444.1 hypothetical protein N7474_006035 [Penicillium riverlandense]
MQALLTTLAVLAVGLPWSHATSYDPLKPPSYPLAVRSPYLSAWIPGNDVASLPSSQAQFWAGNTLGWSLFARVNGDVYSLFGVPEAPDGVKPATVTEATYTSTHSIFTVEAGARTLTLDFFSPVSPKNYLRQSLPFSYLTVTVKEGISSAVQIYSDIDSSWTGQSTDSSWSYSAKHGTQVFQISAKGTATFSQNADDQALWGSAVYASRSWAGSRLSTASGPASAVRGRFVSHSTLTGTHADWTADGVVAFVHDLHTFSDTRTVTFAVGHVREEAIDYLGATQTGYYRSEFSDTADAVSHFLDDYTLAQLESTEFDRLIYNTGDAAYGSNYSDILALSVRQVYGGIELTIPYDSLDTSQTRAFIKEISSDGNINTVDVIYATFPIFYILSPDYIKLLLSPIFDYMGSDAYDKQFAVHDIGKNYPNATGHLASGEAMPIEESGNVIILSYAYQKATGNTDLATTYAAQLEKYATYLNENGLYPAAQLSLNDALGPLANQTNLGVKAAVGLAAYGALTGQQKYIATGKDWADKIWTDHLGTDAQGTHFLLQYGTPQWFLVFNHYADLLFNLDVFPKEAFNATSEYYPTVRAAAGVALDESVGWGQTNWQSFVAATVDGDTREMFISDMHSYISNGLNTAPFCDRYWVQTSGSNSPGEAFAFRARPTLGSHFALAALRGANTWL